MVQAIERVVPRAWSTRPGSLLRPPVTCAASTTAAEAAAMMTRERTPWLLVRGRMASGSSRSRTSALGSWPSDGIRVRRSARSRASSPRRSRATGPPRTSSCRCWSRAFGTSRSWTRDADSSAWSRTWTWWDSDGARPLQLRSRIESAHGRPGGRSGGSGSAADRCGPRR